MTIDNPSIPAVTTFKQQILEYLKESAMDAERLARDTGNNKWGERAYAFWLAHSYVDNIDTNPKPRVEPSEKWRAHPLHVLMRENDQNMRIFSWWPPSLWIVSPGTANTSEFMAENGWRYIGPVLTPDEIKACEDVAFRRGEAVALA
jgi:hypothetical protein